MTGAETPRELFFAVPPEWDGASVQDFLQRGQGLSTRLLRRLKRAPEGLTADGRPVRSVDVLSAGQTVRLRLPPDAVRVAPVSLPLSVVYEDDAVLVVDKPPYIAVHPQGDKYPDPTMAAAIVAHYAQNGQSLAFRPAGRLDRNTSGLLMAAKNPHASFRLNHTVEKTYTAIVRGRLEGRGTVDAPIRVREGHGIFREVGDGGQPSVTHWESLAAGEGVSLIRLTLETGRTHQIRVHMAWLGHPLAGDGLYGGEAAEAASAEDGSAEGADDSGEAAGQPPAMGRHALHCSAMRFPHPVTGRDLRLCAPLPEDMRALLNRAGLPYDSPGNL